MTCQGLDDEVLLDVPENDAPGPQGQDIVVHRQAVDGTVQRWMGDDTGLVTTSSTNGDNVDTAVVTTNVQTIVNSPTQTKHLPSHCFAGNKSCQGTRVDIHIASLSPQGYQIFITSQT